MPAQLLWFTREGANPNHPLGGHCCPSA